MKPTEVGGAARVVPAIELTDVRLRHDSVGAITLELYPDGHLVLSGARAAGKSSLIQAILNERPFHSGRIAIGGLDVRRDYDRVREGLAVVPAAPSIDDPRLPVASLFDYHDAYSSRFDLAYARTLFAEYLGVRLNTSLGQLEEADLRQLQFILAIAHRPALLVLDDPLRTLDPPRRARLLDAYISHFGSTPGAALLLTSDPAPFDRVATRVGVLERGALVLEMSVDALYAVGREYVLQTPRAWRPPQTSMQLRVHRRTDDKARVVGWGDPPSIERLLAQSGAAVLESRALAPFRLLAMLGEAQI